MEKSQNCEIKSRNNLFFDFFSVAETGYIPLSHTHKKKKLPWGQYTVTVIK